MLDVVRAWKDPVYRASLSPDEKKDLPDNPAGESWNELEDDDLDGVAGGAAGGAAGIPPDLEGPITSGGHICTVTTECPIASICCAN